MTMTITGHQKVMKEDSRAYGRFALNTQKPSSSMPDSPDLEEYVVAKITCFPNVRGREG